MRSLVLVIALNCAMPASTWAQAGDALRVWHAYNGAEERALSEALDAYRAETGTSVSVLAVAFGAYSSKLESAIPAGHGPDLFIDAHGRVASYQRAGLVAPLVEDGGSAQELAAFLPAHVDALRVEGKVYGAPLALKSLALYVNRDLAERVGLSEAPSLEELRRAQPKLDAGAFAFAAPLEDPYYLAGFAHALGAAYLDDGGAFAFMGERAVATLELARALQTAGVSPEEADADLIKRLFSSGDALSALAGPWIAPDLPEGLDWFIAPMPSVDGRSAKPFLTIESAYVSASSSRKTEARALAFYLASGPGAEVRARVGGQVRADLAQVEAQSASPFARAALVGTPIPTHAHMKAVWEPILKATRSVLRSGAEPQRAVEEAQRRFADATRPLPEARSPMPLLIVLGVFLLLGSVFAVRRARTQAFRVAFRRSLPAYRYMLHAFFAVGLLVVLPLLVGAGTSFFAGRGFDMHYVGLANYALIITNRGADLLATGSFWRVLVVTVLWTAANLSLHVALGVALALLLNLSFLRGRPLLRVLLILPWAVPNYVTALAWKGMFHRQFGAINALIEAFGGEPMSWFGSFATAFSANLATNVWLGFPFMMVVTLGALTTIPKDLYDAAAVDGASRWQRFRHVTLPMLVPVLAPAVIMGSVWTFNMFNVVFLVSGGEPDGATEILVSEAYRWAFTRSSQYGYAAAYAVLIFAVLLVGTLLSRKLQPQEAQA